MRSFFVIVFLNLILFASMRPTPAAAEGSIYTKLKDPVLVKRFNHISQEIMCQCGCQLPLNMCNHRYCGAWAIRDAIERLLKKGYSDEKIIHGFLYGFGDMVDSDSAFEMARQPEYVEMGMPELFKKGFGEQGRSHPAKRNPILWVVIAGFLMAGVSILYLRKRKQKKSTRHLSDEERDALMKEINSRDTADDK